MCLLGVSRRMAERSEQRPALGRGLGSWDPFMAAGALGHRQHSTSYLLLGTVAGQRKAADGEPALGLLGTLQVSIGTSNPGLRHRGTV